MVDTNVTISNIIIGVTASIATLGDNTPLLIAGVGAFLMNEQLYDTTKRIAVEAGKKPIIHTFRHKIYTVLLGIFIAYIVLEVSRYLGHVDEHMIRALAGTTGAMSPHIIDILRDRNFIQRILRKRLSK